MISVIIPVYNTPKELKKCLESLAGQTFRDPSEIADGSHGVNFEVIVVDDGSNPAINTNICKEPLNIKWFRIEHGGAGRARNFGFQQSRGEFVLFCDADMELRKDCLQKMFTALKNNPAKAYAYSDFKYGWKIFYLWNFDAEKLKKNNYISVCSLLRREDFLGFDQSLKRFQDWDLWLSLLEKEKAGVYIPEVLFKASTASGNISLWLPKIFYKFSFLKRVKEYEKARAIILKKHSINLPFN